jgi:hypothetical protein
MSWKRIDFTTRQAKDIAVQKASSLDKGRGMAQDPRRLENGIVAFEPPLHEGKARSNGVRYPEMMFSPSKPTGKHVPLPNEGPAHRWPSEKDFGHDYTVTRDVR